MERQAGSPERGMPVQGHSGGIDGLGNGQGAQVLGPVRAPCASGGLRRGVWGGVGGDATGGFD